MSGLCGWLAQDPSSVSIERMATPINRYERTPLQSVVAGSGAAALAGSIDCTSLFHEDGLIVALWGGPGQHAALLAQRWRRQGVWACGSLAGQFAFAIIDARAGEALLAVDRCASRPMHYEMAGQTLLFSSSQDALLRHPLAGRDASPQALYDYLALGVMPASAWEGQHQLGPGEYVHLRAGRLVRQQWWRMRFHEHSAPPTGLAVALGTAMARLEGSLQPGVMLDAGLASGALAAPRGGEAPAATFSVIYATTGRVARHDGKGNQRDQHAHTPANRHHSITVTPTDLIDAIPKLAACSDRPCGDSRAVAAYFCASLARAQGTLRLLDGAGADALFGAGELALRQRRLGRYLALPAPLRQLLVEPVLARWRGAAWVDRMGRDLAARIVEASPFAPATAAQMLAPALLAAVDVDAPLALLRRWWWSAQCKDSINRAIALDLQLALPAQVAAATHGCALAGVDVAFPFLDPAVIECASHTDPRNKHGGRGAPHLHALRTLAPGHARRGLDGALPFSAWLASCPELRMFAFDSLSDLRRRHVVAASVIDGLLSRPKDSVSAPGAALVWQLMMLEQWFVYRAPHRLLTRQRPPAAAASAAAHVEVARVCRADDPLQARQME